MKLTLSALCLALLAANPAAMAKDLPIRLDTYAYSSPAKLHLSIIQGALAQKASEACGSEDKVRGLSDITIKLSNSLEGRDVAILERGERGPSLMLIYPKISAEATVSCLD